MRFEKTYLSRAVTRSMGMDHPIGDPFGGPAYGERRDPISAIISVASMAGTYAAAGSFAAMTLMQGLTFAGAALSLVGNITGNKTLSKIGMVAGIAGGVGTLAESVMGTTFGGTLGETFGFGEAASSAPLSGTPTAGPQTPVVDGVQVNAIPDPAAAEIRSLGPGGLDAPAGSVNAPGGATSPLNAGPAALGGAPADALATSPYSLGGPASADLGTGLKLPGGEAPLTLGKASTPGVMDSIKAGNYGQALSTAGSNIMDFAKNNPGGAYMLGNAASGVADWLSGKSDAEIAALEAQVGFADARALQIQEEIAREKRRRTNLNAGYQNVNQNIAVNPNATIPLPWQQQQGGGLIAGQMPPGGG